MTTGPELLAVSDRDRILQAMAECCAEQGFAETRIAEVLERAEVSREDFNSHFADKEDCAAAAFNKLVSDALARLSTAGEAGSSEFAAAARTVLELVAAEPSFSHLGMIDFRQGGTPRMHEAYESAARVLSLMIERTLPRAVAAESSYGHTRAALGGAEALLRRELSASRAAGLPSLLPDFIYAVLVPLVGQGEALRQAREAARWAAKEE